MTKQITVTMADMVKAKLNDMKERYQITTMSELVEELIRIGIPEYERIRAMEKRDK